MDPTREELEAMLADYVDGNLAGDELARAEAFLDANPGVREVMSRLMVDSEAIRTLPRVTPPVADVTEDLRGTLERDMLLGGGSLPVETRRLSTPALAIAAMLVVFVGAGVVAFQILGNRPESNVVVASKMPDDRETTREAARSPAMMRTAAPRADADVPTTTPAIESEPADAMLAERSRARNEPAPTIVAAITPPITNVQLASGVVPSDVSDWVTQLAAADRGADGLTYSAATTTEVASGMNRAIVFVVEPDAKGGEVVESAAEYFEESDPIDIGLATRATTDRRGSRAANVTRVQRSLSGLADGGLGDGDLLGARLGQAEMRQQIGISNSVAPTPMEQAIGGTGSAFRVTSTAPGVAATQSTTTRPTTGPTTLVDAATKDVDVATTSDAESIDLATATVGVIARSVPEDVAARWQAQTDASLGLGKVLAYEVPTQQADASRVAVPFGSEAMQGATQIPVDGQQQNTSQMSQLSGVPLAAQQQQQMLKQAVATDTSPMVDVYVVVRSKARVSETDAATQPTTLPTTSPAATQPN